MGDIVAPKAGIHQAFAAADVTISQSVRAIVSLMQRPGLIRIGFDDLFSALRSGPHGRCLFGYGESDSDNRAHDALTQALKNPLMDRGRMLSDAANVLVQVAGGPGMTLVEVEALMQDLGRHIDDKTQILFGASVDGRMGNRLAVTLITSLAAEGEIVQKPLFEKPVAVRPPRPAPIAEPEPEPPAVATVERDEEFVAEQEFVEPPPPIETPQEVIEPSIPEPAEAELIAPTAQAEPEIVDPEPQQPRVILPRKKPMVLKEVKPPVEKPVEKIVQAKQEVLQFESVTRGRFEKSEPTIVEGQDLDVPTFLRKNVRVK
jgi:cell division protein FtsZ